MKKLLLLVMSLISLAACGSQTDIPNQVSDSPDGFRQLSEEVYILEDIKYPRLDSIAIYSIIDNDYQQIHNNILEWQGTLINYERVQYDNQDEILYYNDKFQMTLADSRDQSNLALNLFTPHGSLADSLYQFLINMQEFSLPGNEKIHITDFQTQIEPDIPTVKDKVEDFIDVLSITMDYEMVIRAISKEDIILTQENLLEVFEMEEIPLEILEENIDPFYFVQIKPEINGMSVIDDSISFGTTDQLNVINGTLFNLIVDQQGVVYAIISGLRQAGSEISQLEINFDQINSYIVELFKDLLLENPIQIDSLEIVYAPFPIDMSNREERYTKFEYRPLIKLSYLFDEVPTVTFIDLSTGLEVR